MYTIKINYSGMLISNVEEFRKAKLVSLDEMLDRYRVYGWRTVFMYRDGERGRLGETLAYYFLDFLYIYTLALEADNKLMEHIQECLTTYLEAYKNSTDDDYETIRSRATRFLTILKYIDKSFPIEDIDKLHSKLDKVIRSFTKYELTVTGSTNTEYNGTLELILTTEDIS